MPNKTTVVVYLFMFRSLSYFWFKGNSLHNVEAVFLHDLSLAGWAGTHVHFNDS